MASSRVRAPRFLMSDRLVGVLQNGPICSGVFLNLETVPTHKNGGKATQRSTYRARTRPCRVEPPKNEHVVVSVTYSVCVCLANFSIYCRKNTCKEGVRGFDGAGTRFPCWTVMMKVSWNPLSRKLNFLFIPGARDETSGSAFSLSPPHAPPPPPPPPAVRRGPPGHGRV